MISFFFAGAVCSDSGGSFRVFVRKNPYRSGGGTTLLRSFMFGYNDAAAPDLLENGVVSEEIQRQMIADASARIKPPHPVLPEQVFDFSFTRKIAAALK